MDAKSEQDRRIKEYLGTQRSDELNRLQDPVYQSLLAIGDRYGSSSQDIISAYELTTDYRRQISELGRDQSLTGAERRSQIQKISAESLDEIESLVGAEAAASIQSNAFWGRRGFRQ
jgi:hypothetical protein